VCTRRTVCATASSYSRGELVVDERAGQQVLALAPADSSIGLAGLLLRLGGVLLERGDVLLERLVLVDQSLERRLLQHEDGARR
jgi:hypothetical protein